MVFSFNYPNTPYYLPTTTIIDISANISGIVPNDTVFKINIQLPTGLNIDASNGTISGTTTFASISPIKSYIVDASYSTGVVSAPIVMGVNFLPIFSYPLTPYVIQENKYNSIMPIYLITNLPGIVYTLAPQSPLLSDISMNLDSTDGLIYGSPSPFSFPTTYTIRANNFGLLYDVTLSISVQTLPVISYPQSIYILTQGVPVDIIPLSSIYNLNVTYSINGCPLPTGLTFNTNTGEIVGTPLLPNTYRQYTITATNVIGSSSTILILNIIKITLAPPVLADDINAGFCLTNPLAAMRRKAEILQYKNNSAGFTKNQLWSLTVRGKGPYANRVWANQNGLGSTPNISGLPTQGNTIICNTSGVICAPTSSSDVPGPITTLCYDPTIPLIGYGNPTRKRVNIGFKWPQRAWQLGDMGFPVGKAGSDIGSG